MAEAIRRNLGNSPVKLRVYQLVTGKSFASSYQLHRPAIWVFDHGTQPPFRLLEITHDFETLISQRVKDRLQDRITSRLNRGVVISRSPTNCHANQ